MFSIILIMIMNMIMIMNEIMIMIIVHVVYNILAFCLNTISILGKCTAKCWGRARRSM